MLHMVELQLLDLCPMLCWSWCGIVGEIGCKVEDAWTWTKVWMGGIVNINWTMIGMWFKKIGIKNKIFSIINNGDLITRLLKYNITWYDDHFVMFSHQPISLFFHYSQEEYTPQYGGLIFVDGFFA
jgi:hypothetical protein